MVQTRLLLVLALMIGAVALSGILFLISVATQRSPLQGTPNPGAPIVGTWRGEGDNLVNFRLDGTVRSRQSGGQKLGYSEWNLDESNELRIYHIVSTKSSAWKSRSIGFWGIASLTIVTISLRFRQQDSRCDQPEVGPRARCTLSPQPRTARWRTLPRDRSQITSPCGLTRR